jgi:hypothetical protein
MLPAELGLDGGNVRGHSLFHQTRDGRGLAAIERAAQRMIRGHAIGIHRALAVLARLLDLTPSNHRLVAETVTRQRVVIIATQDAGSRQKDGGHSRSAQSTAGHRHESARVCPTVCNICHGRHAKMQRRLLLEHLRCVAPSNAHARPGLPTPRPAPAACAERRRLPSIRARRAARLRAAAGGADPLRPRARRPEVFVYEQGVCHRERGARRAPRAPRAHPDDETSGRQQIGPSRGRPQRARCRCRCVSAGS